MLVRSARDSHEDDSVACSMACNNQVSYGVRKTVSRLVCGRDEGDGGTAIGRRCSVLPYVRLHTEMPSS